MELWDAIRARHSYRRFRELPVPNEAIATLVEAVAQAPSSMNSQPWRLHIASGAARDRVAEVMALTTVHLQEYVDVLGPELVEEAAEFYTDLGNAPVVIALSVPSTGDELDRINMHVSSGCAIENLMLAATEAGLGTCNITFGFWVRDQLREVFGLPQDRVILAMVLVGYPDEEPVAPEHRLDIAEYLE